MKCPKRDMNAKMFNDSILSSKQEKEPGSVSTRALFTSHGSAERYEVYGRLGSIQNCGSVLRAVG